MAAKTGRLTLELTMGKDTAIGGYVDWTATKLYTGDYEMLLELYCHVDNWGSDHTRNVEYHFKTGGLILSEGTKDVVCNRQYYKIAEYTLSIPASDVDETGRWNGNFGAYVGYYSSSSGWQQAQSYSDLDNGLVIGTVNYTVSYYTGYGYNDLWDQISIEEGDTHNIIDDTLSRSSDVSTSNFTITGNKNTGDSNKSVKATKTVTTNYTFKGWSTTNGASTASYTASSTITVNKNITLYAVWSESTSTSYKNNTIGNLGSTTKKASGSFFNITLIPNNGEASGTIEAGSKTTYTFKGWASSSTSTTILSSSKSYTSDTTVYAVWGSSTTDKSTVDLPTPSRSGQTVDSYTITLNPLGGTVNPKSLNVSKSKSYKFLGWSTISNDSSGIVSNPYTPTNKSAHSLYAIWEESQSGGSVTLPAPTYPTFKFLGWAINPNSTTYVPTEYVPTQDITLYAIYKASYTGEPYIWHDGKWCKVIPQLRYDNVFNGCINAM